MSFGFFVAMAGRILIFDDNFSVSEVDSQPGSNSEMGDDLEVTLAGASEQVGSG